MAQAMTTVSSTVSLLQQRGANSSVHIKQQPNLLFKTAAVSRHTLKHSNSNGFNTKRSITIAAASSAPLVHTTTSDDKASSSAVEHFDFLVLGSGIAGLSYALKVAEHGRVAVITKAEADEGCTVYAQGGICAVLDISDSVSNHVRDTMVAGAYLNDPKIVELVCREGPQYVLELVDFGARFTRTHSGDLHLTREGGHSARRIVHAADATGAEVQRALLSAAAAHPSIQFFEHHQALDLVTSDIHGVRHALGADVLNKKTMKATRFLAPVTMLATGGGGQVYPNTTNPTVATGDGMAMAFRARAAVANMEFVQFHPTALYRPGCPAPSLDQHAKNACDDRYSLITEAVRGEGGLLYNLNGHRFMPDYEERAELAPRDIVSRAIHNEMTSRGDSHVLLDISHLPSAKVLEHFPNIAAQCRTVGVDITKDPIPVAPAQHYMCGGVLTGESGETNIAGLFACGEVACSGLHGANRLASNSLLEGLVFGNRAVQPSIAHAQHITRNAGSTMLAAAQATDFTGSNAPRPLTTAASVWVATKRNELRQLMWQSAGIIRSEASMRKALSTILEIDVNLTDIATSCGLNSEVAELRNLVTVGEMIMSSALQRRESRGGHYRADYPDSVPRELRATVIKSNIGTATTRRTSIYKSRVVVAGPNGQSPQFGRSLAGKRGSNNNRQLSLTRSVEE